MNATFLHINVDRDPTLEQSHKRIVQELRLMGMDKLADDVEQAGPEKTVAAISGAMTQINRFLPTAEEAYETLRRLALEGVPASTLRATSTQAV